MIQNIKYKTKHIIPVSFLFCGVSLFIVSLWLYSEPKTKADGVVNPNYIASVDAKAAAIQERRLMDNEEVERFDQRQHFELNEDQESFAQQNGEVAVRQEEDDLNEKKVTAIGDSVLLGAAREVEKVITGIYIDSEVSRQMKQALSVIEKLRNENRLGDIVVISLGTNGPFTEQQLEEVLNALDDVEYIFFVNVRVPRNWQDVVNETLEKVKEGYENVFIIDWYRQSKDHPEYFVQDGVHLTKTGASHYAALIADAIHSKMEKAERKRSILPE